ncbi:MAG TPA: hypothetical protein VLM37_06965 [Fibrobacteraceae bacterium]|nr:hypothetical protein [Fibrobacteraceae bacterium]
MRSRFFLLLISGFVASCTDHVAELDLEENSSSIADTESSSGEIFSCAFLESSETSSSSSEELSSSNASSPVSSSSESLISSAFASSESVSIPVASSSSLPSSAATSSSAFSSTAVVSSSSAVAVVSSSAAASKPAIIFVVDESVYMDTTLDESGPADSLHWRAKLVRNAIGGLQDRGVAWFAYVEFATEAGATLDSRATKSCSGITNVYNDSVLTVQHFLETSDSIVSDWSGETGPVQLRCRNNRNYASALDTAKSIARALDTVDASAVVSVIFISGGNPTKDTSNTFLPLDTAYSIPGAFPPIHGLFLGDTTTSDDSTLVLLTESSTGGSFHAAGAADTTAMESAMEAILDAIFGE